MSSTQFDNIITLLNDQNLDSVKQGLMLWETLMDLDEGRAFYQNKLKELDFTELKGTFSYGFGGKKVPAWLRPAKFRLYVALWALGYLAKHEDETALSIKKIELNDPAFFTFPETFVHLTELTHFELQRSKWTALDDVWAHFPNLVGLDLFDNELTTLPMGLANCTKLQRLNLSYNPISELPECVRSLTALTELQIRNFEGDSLPEWFGELRELRKLNAESASLTSLPESIGSLKNLESLLLRWSKLSSLPDSIGDCVALKSMDIASTEVATLPSRLPVLKVWESRLNKVWSDLPRLTQLHTLEIWTGDLKREVDFAWFPNLKSLTINSGHCTLKNIEQCTLLEKLDLSREQRSIPDSICQMSALKELNLSYTEIKSLPNDIGQLTSLRKIGLSSLDLSESELLKLTPLLPKLSGTMKQYSSSKREARWFLNVDAFGDAKPVEKFRQRLLMKSFANISEMSKVEQVSGFLDAQTPCADVSSAPELRLLTLHADEPVSPLWLENLSPSPQLEMVKFKCKFTEFPNDAMRRLLGDATLSEDGELKFPVEVSVSKEYELDLWNLKLEIAKEQGLLSQVTSFASKVLTTIPKLLPEASSLVSLSCKETLCVDIPESVLRLPNLMSIEAKGDEKPDVWPIRTVTFHTLETFLQNVSRYDNLRRLDLKGAWLSEVPKSVLQIETLRALDLSWNRLTQLPKTVSAWTNLTTLSLTGNALSNLPQELLNLPNISIVDIPKTMDADVLKTEYPEIDFRNWQS